MPRLSSWALAAALGCGRPDVLVICHNANCTTESRADDDDTPKALAESLELHHEGRPMLDGIEIDLRHEAGMCRFAHDPAGGVDAAVAQTALTERLARGEIAHGDRFHLFVELKSDPASDVAALVACGVDFGRAAVAAADEGEVALSVVIGTGDPRVAAALVDRGSGPFAVAAGFGESPFRSSRLSAFPNDIDAVSVHVGNLKAGLVDALHQDGKALIVWQRLATSELFEAIRRYSPTYVTTNEAERLRRWLDE